MRTRELGHSELLRVIIERDERVARGESVVDLRKFEPYVCIDDHGQEWLIYRRRSEAA